MENIEEFIREMKLSMRYEPDSGLFVATRKAPFRHVGKPIGTRTGYRKKYPNPKGYYLSTSVMGKTYLLHRLAWLYVYGVWPKYDIDHIDGNPSNNRISNLRDAPRKVNCQNRTRVPKHSKSGVLGVSKDGPSWRARIVIDGKQIRIGAFRTKEDARAAYLQAKKLHHIGFIAP